LLWNCCTTSYLNLYRQTVNSVVVVFCGMLRTCCTSVRFVVDLLWILLYSLLYNKSTTNRTSGGRPLVEINQNNIGQTSRVLTAVVCFSNLFTGSHIGILVGMQGSGILCKRYGWESAFYVFGKIIYIRSILRLSSIFIDKQEDFLYVHDSGKLFCSLCSM